MAGNDPGPHCHLVGGGVASLAAAVFLIRDVGLQGNQISIYEQTDVFGGSLDGTGSAESGYLIRGGRMFEEHFVCTFDLLATIPAGDAGGPSVRDDIMAFNRAVVGSSRCRLVRGGRKADMTRFGLSKRDILDLVRLVLRSERALQGRTIEQCFNAAFFGTNFWHMWCTTFAFQPWHGAMELRRYLRRFIHLFPGFKRLAGILRTRYNQYDSLIVPIVTWLENRGVDFRPLHQVTDLQFEDRDGIRRVRALHLRHAGAEESVPLAEHDRVLLTLGSITDASDVGTATAPPRLKRREAGGAWQLWCRLADREPGLGRPLVFCGDVDRSKWMSFTVTLHRPDFLAFMEKFSGNATGTGGLVSFTDSNWLISIAMVNQPHFHDQTEGVSVFWGYGLFPDRPGDFVAKPMSACGGQDILCELAGHLRLGEDAERLLGGAICRPCMMPFITSQFMPRSFGDRPPVVPWPGSNLAVMGQFCELRDDVVFTVEYSVRSAMTAVYALFDSPCRVPGVRRTDRDPLVLWRAVRTLLKG